MSSRVCPLPIPYTHPTSLPAPPAPQHWAQLPSLRWTAPPVEHSSIAERGNAVLAAHLTAGAHIPLPAGIPATISRTAAAANSAPPPARRTWHAAFHPVVANLCPVLNAFSLFRAPSRRGRGTGQLNRAAIYPMGSGVGSALGGQVPIPVDACGRLWQPACMLISLFLPRALF